MLTIRDSRRRLRYDPPPLKVRATVEPAALSSAPEAAAPVAMVFRGAALTAQTITAPEWLLAGPAETGKTWAGLWRLDSEARRLPGSQWVLARKSRVTMDSTVLKTWARVTAVRGGVTVFGGQKAQWYDYANGARVWVVGFDNPDKILSGEFDGIYVNQAEELDESDWETATTRATGRGAVTETPMVWGDCNPGPEEHWVIRRMQAGSLVRLDSRHEDNPTLHDGQGWTAQGRRSLAALDRLTGVRYQRLRMGLWVGAEGQFFTEWDDDRHVRRLDLRPQDGHVWGALDYGFAHPLAFGLFCAIDGVVYLLAEHVANRLLVKQHAEAIRELCARHGVDVAGLRIVAGHDCWASRGGDDRETIADKFAKAGIALERATIERINGAQAVLERLGNKAAEGRAETPPTLFIDPDCRRTIATIPRMVGDPRRPEDVRKVDADAEGRGGDDCYDMLRYGVMDAPAAPAPAPAAGGERTAYAAPRRGTYAAA